MMMNTLCRNAMHHIPLAARGCTVAALLRAAKATTEVATVTAEGSLEAIVNYVLCGSPPGPIAEDAKQHKNE